MTAPFRILVTGSRDWDDRLTIYRALNSVCEAADLLYPPDQYGNTLPDPSKFVVVHGACPTGADRIADDWCVGNFFLAEEHPADWETHGKAAGPIRNAEMVNLGADICLAFPLPSSRGTKNCMRLAREAGIPIAVYNYQGLS